MTPRERLARLDTALARRTAAVRNDDRRRRIALVSAIGIGLGLAWIHWLGLIVGGALVGLTRRGLAGAIVAGAGFGAITVALTGLVISSVGMTGLFALSRLTLVTVVAGITLPVWGALLRGVV